MQRGLIPPTLAIDDYAAVLFEDQMLVRTVSWTPTSRLTVSNENTEISEKRLWHLSNCVICFSLERSLDRANLDPLSKEIPYERADAL
jgi:hypothetical protein